MKSFCRYDLKVRPDLKCECRKEGAVRLIFILVSLLVTIVMPAVRAKAQDPANIAQGMSATATYFGSDWEVVDTGTGRLNLRIPLLSDHSQRGNLNFDYILSFSSPGPWIEQCDFDVYPYSCSWLPTSGVDGIRPVMDGALMLDQDDVQDFYGPTVHDADGAVHVLQAVGAEFPDSSHHQLESQDGSGIQSDFDCSQGYGCDTHGLTVSVTNNKGVSFVNNYVSGFSTAGNAFVEDTNGNKMTMSSGVAFGSVPAVYYNLFSGYQFGNLGSFNYYPYSAYTMTDTLGRSWSYSQASDTSGCPSGADDAYIWTTPGTGSTTRTFEMCYSNVSVSTSLPNDMGVTYEYQYSASQDMLTAVVLPDNTNWRFQYDTWGNVTQVSLPTGGVYNYGYTTTFACIDTPWGREIRTVISRETPDGTWTYGFSEDGYVVTDPSDDHNQTVYYGDQECGDVSRITHYAGSASSGTVLEVDNTQYESNGCVWGALRPTAKTTSWPAGANYITAKVSSMYDAGFTGYCYDDEGYFLNNFTAQYSLVPTTETHYDYGMASAMPSRGDWPSTSYMPTAGSAMSVTNRSFLAVSNSSYMSPANLIGLVSANSVTDASGHLCSETDYGYDGTYGAEGSGVSEQHTSAPFSVRGNLTSVTRQLFTSPCSSSPSSETALMTSNHVYDTGMVHESIDPRNNAAAIYTYSSTYYGAYPTQVCNAATQCTTYAYDFNTGLTTSMTDPNSQPTYYHYDCMLRPNETDYPDLGVETWTARYDTGYGCNGAVYQGSKYTKKIDSTQTYQTVENDDGLGRRIETQLTSDPDGTDYTDSAYDANGRIASVTNPCRSTPASGCGYTSYAYDALGRVTTTTEQDGSTITKSYLSFPCTTVTDEAGKQRKACVDGANRIVGVWEDPASANYETDYTYDPNGDLTQVTQIGGDSSHERNRYFYYDSLSRLTKAINPESGSACYGTLSGTTCRENGYDANGNVVYKTDARGITITSSYDPLNRLTQKLYSDSTPGASYNYDETSAWGHSITNGIGRLTTSGNTNAAELLMYDAMGRPTTQMDCLVGSSCTVYTKTTQYDLAGAITSTSNGEGVTISYTKDGAIRTSAVTSDLVDSDHPANLATVTWFWPSGIPNAMTLGNGLMLNAFVNNRLQTCRMNLTTGTSAADSCYGSAPSGTVQDFQYGFNYGSGDNGNLMSMTAAGSATYTQTFGRGYTYDNLNRLSSLSASSDPTGCYGLTWTYDAWGNRSAQTTTGGSCPSPSAGYSTSNQITGFTYDAAGNLTYDGTHYYYYDAENRLIQLDGSSGYCSTGSGTAAAACYTYDANGHRVQKIAGSAATGYLYDTAGNIETEFSLDSGVWEFGYVYMDGSLLAEYENSTTRFVMKDNLGSARIMTDVDGSPCESVDYLPFGEQSASGSCDTSHRFTGKERDSESNLDYFGARYMSSQYGRFMTPDSAVDETLSVALPYAELSNPQSLNLYSYVRNNPLSFTDPDGQNVNVCVDDGNGKQQCQNYTDEQYQKLYNAQNGQQGINLPGGQFPRGNITCGGQTCGSATYNEAPLEDQTAGMVMSYEGGKLGGILLGKLAGAIGGMLGKGAGELAGETAGQGGAKVLLSGGSKQAAKEIVEGLADGAQKASAKRAIAAATRSEAVSISESADGTITVTRTRAGFDGSQTFTKTIDSAGNSSTVQTAHDAAGNLVHYDPKN